MSYFDFHLHPTFKKYLCAFETEYPTSRTGADLRGEIHLKNPITDLLEEEFLHILESQSCVDQLEAGKVLLGVAAIAPVEEVFTGKQGIFGKMLNSKFFTKPVDQTYFTKIRNSEISYYQLFLRELSLFKALDKAGAIQLLSRKNRNNGPDGAKLAVAIGIEGGHSLSRAKIRRPGQLDTSLVVSGQGDALSKDFQKDIPSGRVPSAAESLQRLQQAMWDENMDICYLILTHLSHIQEQILATHAYGIKMIESERVFPRGNGITQAGKEVIDAAYTLTVKVQEEKHASAPVLIDIKHMALKSRLDLYAYRKEKGYEQMPLLASHMGVTGYSIDEWKAAFEEARLITENDIPVVGLTIDRKSAGEWGFINKKFTYNAWSINLMDEDIEEVLASGGLIGISLDVRILGWQNIISKGDKEEILSWENFKYFFPDKFKAMTKGMAGFEESFLKPTQEERHPLALCFNLLHVVQVGRLTTRTLPERDPWKSICIGSDFDGLIDPLINCRDASKFQVLERLLMKWLPIADEAYCKEHAAESLLPRNSNKNVDLAKLQNIVKGILYENGKAFMEKWQTGELNKRI